MMAPAFDSLRAGNSALVMRTADMKLMSNESCHSSSGMSGLHVHCRSAESVGGDLIFGLLPDLDCRDSNLDSGRRERSRCGGVRSGPNGLCAVNGLAGRGLRGPVLEANPRRAGGALGAEELIVLGSGTIVGLAFSVRRQQSRPSSNCQPTDRAREAPR